MRWFLQQAPLWQRRPALVAAAIIFLTTAVRLWFVASEQLDLVQDEAQYWDWTRRLQLSYYSKGPLIAWVIKLWTGVFGDTGLGVRFGAVLHSCLAQMVLYFGVARLMRMPSVALWTLVIANTTPLFMVSGILMTTDSPLLLCWAVALFSLYWAGEREDAPLPYVLLAVSMALGLLAKYMMLAMFGVAVLYMAGLYRHRMLSRRFALRALTAMAVGAAAGFAPILIWNMQHDWVGFKHVGTLAGVTSSKPKPLIRFDRFPEYFGAQVGLITPWWFVFMLAGAWRALSFLRNGSAPVAVREDLAHVRRSLLLAAGFWMLWLFFIVWSFHTRIYPNWSAMSYVAGIILAAMAVDRGTLMVRRAAVTARGRRFAWRPVWVGLGMAVFLLVHGLTYLPLPEKLNPAVRLMGWHDLGNKLGEVQRSLPDPDKVFFFSSAYDVTASLAYYAPGKPYTYCVDFGRRMSQYDLWPGPQDKVGWDAVYVGKENPPVPPGLAAMFEESSYIRYETTHRGRKGRTFYIVTLRNFNGHWPRQSFGVY